MSSQDGIIILGAPRSGTTLVRRLLDAHPDIDCPGETYLLGAASRFLRREATPQGVEMGVLPGLKLLGFEEQEVRTRLRELVTSFHEDHARRAGKSRWAMKTAVDVFYLDEIERLLAGHARFVCIVRHGLDVVASMAEMTGETGAFLTELHEYVKDTTWPLEAYARAWVDSTRKLTAFAARHPDDAILLRYEDLIADTENVLGAILDRIGAARDPDLVDRALRRSDTVGLGDWKTYRVSEVTSASVGRYAKLPRPALARLVPIVADELGVHGYDVPEVSEETNSRADRRTRLAMLLNRAKDGERKDEP